MMKPRKTWISAANVCACLGVIYLHCNDFMGSAPGQADWSRSLLLQTLFFWPVPVFFMLSGATLVTYREKYSTREFFRRRFQRTVIPFLVWDIVAAWYRIVYTKTAVWSVGSFVINTLNHTFSSGYQMTYWFFPAIFAVYLCMPLLSAVEGKLRDRVFSYMIPVIVIVNSVIPLLFALAGQEYDQALALPVGGFLPYVMIGNLIAHRRIPVRGRIFLYLGALLGWAGLTWGTEILSVRSGSVQAVLLNYRDASVVLMSAGIMTAFRYFPYEKVFPHRACAAIERISSYTLGIYLMHYYLVEQIPRHLRIDIDSLGWYLGGPLLIFAVCLAASWILSRIPLLRATIGLAGMNRREHT